MSSKFEKQIHNLHTSKELIQTLMKEAKKPRNDLVVPNQENLDSLFLNIDLLNFEILTVDHELQWQNVEDCDHKLLRKSIFSISENYDFHFRD